MKIPEALNDTLLWSDEHGYGFHPRAPITYADDYWEKYLTYDATEMGALLTAARVELVKKYYHGPELIDIGIGGGRFVREVGGFGFDVSEKAIAWLKETNRFANPYESKFDAITCWDSIEHIVEPEKLLAQVKKWLFVSMPVYMNQADCLTSKHYRPGEHIHYWTIKGFIKYCKRFDFRLMELSTVETELGREGITTFVFKRD